MYANTSDPGMGITIPGCGGTSTLSWIVIAECWIHGDPANPSQPISVKSVQTKNVAEQTLLDVRTYKLDFRRILPHQACQQVRIPDETLRLQVLPLTFSVPDPGMLRSHCSRLFFLGLF